MYIDLLRIRNVMSIKEVAGCLILTIVCFLFFVAYINSRVDKLEQQMKSVILEEGGGIE